MAKYEPPCEIHPDISYCVSEMRVSKRQTIPSQHEITRLFYLRSELRDGMVVFRYFHVQNILRGLTKHGNWSDALGARALWQPISIVFIKQKQAKNTWFLYHLYRTFFCATIAFCKQEINIHTGQCSLGLTKYEQTEVQIVVQNECTNYMSSECLDWMYNQGLS